MNNNKKNKQLCYILPVMLVLGSIITGPVLLSMEGKANGTDITVTVDDVLVSVDGSETGCIRVNNIDNFGSFDISITWDPSVVDVTSISGSDLIMTPYIDHTAGTANINGYSMSGESGDVTLACLEFKGVGGVSCPVEFAMLSLLSADPIPTKIDPDVIDEGEVVIEGGVITETVLSVDDVIVGVGSTANGCIRLTDIDELGSYSVILNWDPLVVDVTDITEGDFIVTEYINHAAGYANINGYTMTSASGDVTLACLEYTGVGGIDCALTLTDIELLSADPTPVVLAYDTIDHGEAVIDGGVITDTVVSVDNVLVGIGSTQEGCIRVSNINGLGSFSINITFDPLVVDVTDVTEGDFIITPYINNAKGYVTIIGYSMSGVSGNVILGCLEYTGIGGVMCDLIIQDVELLSDDPTPQVLGYDDLDNGIATIDQTIILCDDVSINEGDTENSLVHVNNVANFGSFSINISWNPSVIDIVGFSNMSDFHILTYIDHTIGYMNMTGWILTSATGAVPILSLDIKAQGSSGDTSPLTLTYSELLTADPTPQKITHITQDSLVTITSQGGSPPSGGGGGGTTTGNQAPIARISASTTNEIRGVPISFDGSQSSDSDGTIQSYTWDFGDGIVTSAKTTTHAFDDAGTYTVKLIVTDNNGATDVDQITITIIESGNNPPNKPTITGPSSGTKNTEYSFTIRSTDADNDDIRYTIQWGDGTSFTTEFMASGSSETLKHTYDAADRYTLEIIAEDNETVSQTTTHILLIDAFEIYKGGSYIGYLTDENGDEIYDAFNKQSNSVQQTDSGAYLIDTDNDGTWDYTYNAATDSVIDYTEETTTQDNTTLIILAIAVVLILIIAGVLVTRKK